MPRLEDWALVSAADVADLYRAERERWRAELDWDLSDTCDALERARRNGRVPGFVVRQASGAVAGWTYFLLQGGELQIGALVASSPEVTAALVDGALASPAAAVARRTLFFAYTQAPGLERALRERSFDVGAEHYLVRALAGAPGPADGRLRGWRDSDLEPVGDMLQAAYHGPDPRRPFAPSGARHDWCDYVRQLTLTAGCGAFLPALSVVAAGGDTLAGAALVTRVSETTAHLAQMAVRPGMRGHGLGTRLLGRVVQGATDSGFARLSLLVSETNTRARRLYAEQGFVRHGAFVSATRARQRRGARRSDDAQPRRSTSEAWPVDGARTRR